MTVYDDATLDLIQADALREVNALRTANGYEPLSKLPKGERGNARCCVIAKALPGEPDHTSAGDLQLGWWHDEARPGTWIDTPQPIATFIELFDNGEFPHLVIDE